MPPSITSVTYTHAPAKEQHPGCLPWHSAHEIMLTDTSLHMAECKVEICRNLRVPLGKADANVRALTDVAQTQRVGVTGVQTRVPPPANTGSNLTPCTQHGALGPWGVVPGILV